MQSAIKYHGGKSKLARRIVALMPPHVHYVEPYFGGGAVLFAKNPDEISEVVNDIDGDLINFWLVLQQDQTFSRFQRIVEAVPFSEAEFNDARNTLNVAADPVQRAVAFFITVRQSLAGRMDDFASITKRRLRRRMNEQVSAWLTAVEGLSIVHNRLKRVVILDAQDALTVIKAQDGPDTLYYLDPTYLKQTRTAKNVYRFEMTGQQHVDLLKVLHKINGKFLLSGYDNPIYSLAAQKWGWYKTEFNMANSAAGGDSKRRMIECVWTNFEPPCIDEALEEIEETDGGGQSDLCVQSTDSGGTPETAS